MCTQLTNFRVVRCYRTETWRKAWGNESCVSAGSWEYFLHLTAAQSYCECQRYRPGDFFDIVVQYVFYASFADDSYLIFGQGSSSVDSTGFFTVRDQLGYMDDSDSTDIKLLDLKNCNKEQVSAFFSSTQGAYDVTKWLSDDDTACNPETYSDGQVAANRYESWSEGMSYALHWDVISSGVFTRDVALDLELQEIFDRSC